MKVTKTYRLNEITLRRIKDLRNLKVPEYEIDQETGKRTIVGFTDTEVFSSDAEIIQRAIETYYYEFYYL